MVGEERFEHETPLNGHGTLVPRVTEGIKRADEKFVAIIKERPIVAISGALLAGYLIGRLFGGRS